MASIDASSTTLVYTVPGTQPTVDRNAGPPERYDYNSPTIDADGSITLVGAANEDVSGWTLGFIQLKYVGTDHGRYRGATIRDGSALVTNSNTILCRDTDKGSTEVWYDSLKSGGTTGPSGTNKLAAGTKLGADGKLVVRSHLFDQPGRWWETVRPNTLFTPNRDNFLHYAIGEVLFCTMLVAQEPGGAFHMLKHFYWNVIWECTFKRDVLGAVVPDKKIKLQQNVQAKVHSGNPNDAKFKGREYDTTLPISTTITNQTPRVFEAKDWTQG